MIPPTNDSHPSGQEAITLAYAVAQLASARGVNQGSGEIQYVSRNQPLMLGQVGPHLLSCTLADLVRSAISVGRQDWAQVIEHGTLSRFEIVYRAAMIMANLTLGPATGGRTVFRKTAAYGDLDPSEVVAVDFHIGLLVAKLFAEILLHAPWVRHLDGRRPRMPRVLVNPNDGRRPDLVHLHRSGCSK